MNTTQIKTVAGSAPKAAPKKQQSLTSMWKKQPNSSTSTSSSSSSNSDPTADATAVTNNSTSGTTDALPVVVAERVSMDFEDETKRFHGEGRTITVEFDSFILVACYVPNSGEGLVRLDYRINEW